MLLDTASCEHVAFVSVPQPHDDHTAYNAVTEDALPPNATDVPEPFAAVFQPVNILPLLVIAQVLLFQLGALHVPP